ncbi:MAG: MotA/TolQ/ExbB proton channel family protein [Gammaproteobacteria bacterium]|nr:MotA/TolQ/ExbB proton channel family protein [Gammaproteobacteria bacterium]
MMSFFPDALTLSKYYDMGGFVMLPLIIIGVLMWYALTIRMINVQASKLGPRELIKRAKKNTLKVDSITARAAQIAVDASKAAKSRSQLKSVLNERFAEFRTELNQYRAIVRVAVIVSPLLGLLGTIDGMIETFESLGDMALFSQSGGIAGGISRALFTTQIGLAISIPGVMIGRMIERRQMNINRELDQIKDLVWVYKN